MATKSKSKMAVKFPEEAVKKVPGGGWFFWRLRKPKKSGWKVWHEFGIYRGNAFKVFELSIGERTDPGFWILFHFQCIRFCIGLGIVYTAEGRRKAEVK